MTTSQIEGSKAEVWIIDNMIILNGSTGDTTMHKHHAIQLVWSDSSAYCSLINCQLSGSFIINSQVEHQLKLSNGWLFLIEPSSLLGGKLQKLLNRQPTLSINDIVKECKVPSKSIENPIQTITELFQYLDIPLNWNIKTSLISDNRLKKLIDRLDLCLLGKCQKPSSWKAKDIAAELYISESRFLHLFREHMGIPWRPYLKWRRLYCACSALVKGASATDAAHQSGFSDAAHLSRTFRAMFGVSIRQIKELLSGA